MGGCDSSEARESRFLRGRSQIWKQSRDVDDKSPHSFPKWELQNCQLCAIVNSESVTTIARIHLEQRLLRC